MEDLMEAFLETYMETMSQALERFERDGYQSGFRARANGEFTIDGDELFAPEDLVVDEIVRFEGTSDPGDEAVLFALRSRDGRVRGTFATTYGMQCDPRDIEALRRLEVRPARIQSSTVEEAASVAGPAVSASACSGLSRPTKEIQ